MYNVIYRSVVFPRLDRRRGYNLLDRVRRWEELLARSPAEIAGLQADRLQALVRHAASTAPFWGSRFRDARVDPSAIRTVDDLRALPILEKDEVRTSREEMVSEAIPPERRRESMTGGSTASPLRFYRDPECLADREASNWYFFRRMGREPSDRWVLVWGAQRDLGPAQGFKSRLRSRLLDRCLVLPSNRLDEATMDEFLVRMRRFRPRFIHGYSQATYLLARHMEKRGVSVPGVRGISVTAEAMTPEQRETVERAFRAPVFNIYGTREFGYLAAECPAHSGMHLNPLSCVVEIIRPDGSPAAPGEPGQVIVTDLLNRAMPMIRYRIGDVAMLRPGPCPHCGDHTPMLDVAAGRETDFIRTPEGRYISGASITLVSSPGIAKLQYVQEEPEELVIRYVPTASFSDETLAEVETKLVDVFGRSLRFRFDRVDDIPLTPSGKFVYVYSKVARREFGGEPVQA